MRNIEKPQRNRLKERQWHAENFITYNKWLLEIDFHTAEEDVKQLERAMVKPAFAAAAADQAADEEAAAAAASGGGGVGAP
jgi:hypothetical protein